MTARTTFFVREGSIIGLSIYEILATVRSIGLTIGALVWWVSTYPTIDLNQISDLGLLAVLTPAHVGALALLTVNYLLDLRQQQARPWLLILQNAALVYMLYGLPIAIEETPRFSSTWKHIGVAEYITRNGSIDPLIDAYFNWPGFFVVTGFFTELAGLADAYQIVFWASVYFNLLYLGPMYMIFAAVTQDRRVIWLAIWLFYITNWVGQDYYSPQAFVYFLMLAIYGILLQWFHHTPSREEHPAGRLINRYLGPSLDRYLGREIGSKAEERVGNRADSYWHQLINTKVALNQPGHRIFLSTLVVLMFTVIVASHQLTPFAILGTVTLLVLSGRCTLRGLPILMGLIVLFWLNYMAVGYVAGNLVELVGNVGALGGAVNANLTERLQGSEGHLFVVNMRLVMSLAVWGLAFVGGLRRLLLGYRDLSFVAAIISPFALLGLQNYGGELILRTYLYSLPFMVFFIATLFYPEEERGRSWLVSGLIALVCAGLLGCFIITRYGNEKMDYFTNSELAGLRHLYSVARTKSLMATSTNNVPFKYQQYEEFFYANFYREILEGRLLDIIHRMESKKYGDAYLILTRAQEVYLNLFYGFSASQWQAFVTGLRQDTRFELTFENEDTIIFRLKE